MYKCLHEFFIKLFQIPVPALLTHRTDVRKFTNILLL